MILMCEGTNCPLKTACLRFMAIQDVGQHYMAEVPYDKGTKECPKFARLIIGDKVREEFTDER